MCLHEPTFQKGHVIPKDGWPQWGYKESWAPEIHYVDNNFIVYFSLLKTEDDVRAVGYAKSKDPFGPYQVSDAPIIESWLGAIDTTWFRDPV